MHHVLELDERIRDFVFIPMIYIMFFVAILRNFMRVFFGGKETPQTKQLNINASHLNPNENQEEEKFDLQQIISEEVSSETKDTAAVARCNRILMNG